MTTGNSRMNRLGKSLLRVMWRWKYSLIIVGILLAVLLACLALPWYTLAVGSEYRTTISGITDVSVWNFAYDQRNDRFVVALTDGTLQILPRKVRSVPYNAGRLFNTDTDVWVNKLLLHGDYVITCGEGSAQDYAKKNNAGTPGMRVGSYVALYDLDADTMRHMKLLSNAQSFQVVDIAMFGDTLYYSAGAELFQVQLPTPWHAVQPQLMFTESGPIRALLAAPRGGVVIYATGDTSTVTIKEYRAGTSTTLCSTQHWNMTSPCLPGDDNYLLTSSGEMTWEVRETLWQRNRGNAIVLPNSVRVAAIHGDHIIAAMSLLGAARFRDNYPVLALLDARDGTTLGYRHLGLENWHEAILPAGDGSDLLCYVDVERHGYCMVSRNVSIRSDDYLAAAQASRKYLAPLHRLLRVLYAGLRFIGNPLVLLDD